MMAQEARSYCCMRSKSRIAVASIARMMMESQKRDLLSFRLATSTFITYRQHTRKLL